MYPFRNSTRKTTIALLIISVTLLTEGCKKGDTALFCESDNPYLNTTLTYDCIEDIDGNQYATIEIGTQTWMAENLRTTKYNDGTVIPSVTEEDEWADLTNGAWCYFDNDATNNALYGKLYNWYAVETDKLCPIGWHISSDAEWAQLTTYLSSDRGIKIKSAGNITDGTGLWAKNTEESTEGTNESGFTGLPGGNRNIYGSFSFFGEHGFWWSSTEVGTTSAWGHYLSFHNSTVNRISYGKKLGFSCRCVKD